MKDRVLLNRKDYVSHGPYTIYGTFINFLFFILLLYSQFDRVSVPLRDPRDSTDPTLDVLVIRRFRALEVEDDQRIESGDGRE